MNGMSVSAKMCEINICTVKAVRLSRPALVGYLFIGSREGGSGCRSILQPGCGVAGS